MLICSELMQKNYFESYSEFQLALAMAAECGRRGDKLDMSMMSIGSAKEKNILSKQDKQYYRYLLAKGCIYVGEGVSIGEDITDTNTYFDTSAITDLYDVLMKDEGDCYSWSTEYANKTYFSHKRTMLNLSETGRTVLHIIAHYIVCMYLGERPKKGLKIIFSGYEPKNTKYYVNLVSCKLTLPWFDKLVYIDADFSDLNVDVEYSIFVNNAIHGGRIKIWSIDEKKDFMNLYGMVEGSIVVLYKRTGMRENNLAGHITDAIIVKIKKINKDSIDFITIPLNKTKEEIKQDYDNIDDDIKSMFSDMLNFNLNIGRENIPLYSLGVHNYFGRDENNFIDLIDKNGKITKLITVDGKEGEVEMSEVDAIYWLLNQYNVDFDKELYKKMYNDGKNLMWDLYGERGLI